MPRIVIPIRYVWRAPLLVLELDNGRARVENLRHRDSISLAKDSILAVCARYQGGDLLAKVNLAPEQLTPEDFRLRPDSAGYRAGKNNKDLGAEVDLVGPGKAYERWKKTPKYQEWLKETGQR
jgi:hypothetical protein